MTEWPRLRRHSAAGPEEVWAACTKPERLARWLGEVRGSFEEGGEVRVEVGGNVAECVILRCDPPHRLVATWQQPGDPPSAVDVRISAAVGGGTMLAIEHVALVGGALWENGLRALDGLLPSVAEVPAGPANPWTDVAVQGETAVLTTERRYAAAPDEVWSAFTDPVRLRRWFAEVDGDLRAGGTWTATFDDGKASGVVRTCEPGRLLATSWSWDHEETQSELTIRLQPVAGGTLLELRQDNVEARPAAGYGAGWYAYLAVLPAHLAGTDPAEEDWNAEFSLARLAIQRR